MQSKDGEGVLMDWIIISWLNDPVLTDDIALVYVATFTSGPKPR